MNIADIIAALTSGMNPNQAVMQGAPAAVPPQTANAQAALPPQDSVAPQGAQTPVTYPQAPATAPKITQSPPDLANMYIELMRKNQNAQALDRGLTTIAAGFSIYPENRAALLRMAAGEGKAAGATLSANDLIALQKQQTAMQETLLQKSLLGGLAKKYNMSPEQIQYLQSSGKLDEVIKHYSTENLASATDQSSGKTILYNPRSGKTVVELGGAKPEEGTWQDTPEGKRLMSSRSGLPMGPAAGLPPDEGVVLRGPEGERLLGKRSGAVIAGPLGAIPEKWEAQFNQINAERKAAGKPPMGTEEFMKLTQTGTNIYVGQDGSMFKPPPEGQDYERTPEGKVKIGPDGRPKLYTIEGGIPGSKEEREKAELAMKEKKVSVEEADRIKREAKLKVQSAFTASNVGKAVDAALEQVDKAGVTGVGSKWARNIPLAPGGMNWDEYDASVDTIKANTAFEALAQMRQASPNGSALGNVTDFEQKMLASTIDSLAYYRHTDKAKGALIRIKAAMEILADSNFNQDPAKFNEALNKRVEELSVEHANKTGKMKVQRIST